MPCERLRKTACSKPMRFALCPVYKTAETCTAASCCPALACLLWRCRNVFYKKVKARPQTPTIARQFIISKNLFEFGPLLMNKDTTGETSNHALNHNCATLMLHQVGTGPADLMLHDA